jgi:hypothetical protein
MHRAMGGTTTQGNGATNFVFTFSEVVGDACTEELVFVTVTLEGNLHVFIDSSGSSHISEHYILSLIGVGVTTGAVYKGSETLIGHENLTLDANANLTEVMRFTMTGGGSTAEATSLMHTTVNANGTITVFITDIDMTCD